MENSKRDIIRKKVFDAFRPADILLPPTGADMSRWSVIACDQYTSEPEYWRELEDFVGEAPSALKCILPEAFLSEATPSKIDSLNSEMMNYLYNYLISYDKTMIFVERELHGGGTRRGVVGMIDLEEYDYTPGATSAVRATEATVLERIPPRVRIRSGAAIELPHVMILIDDAEKNAVEKIHCEEKLYDFELSGGGGHIRGYKMTDDECDRFRWAIADLVSESDGDAPLVFAVGDGNHSLASAKAWWENVKRNLPDEMKETHPARFALAEIVNLHDETLNFEPIFRLVTGADVDSLASELSKFASECCGGYGEQTVRYITKNGEGEVRFASAPHMLTAGSLGMFLDEYMKAHPECGIDYIHGEDTVRRLAEEEGSMGFVFEGMKKSELFPTVRENGVLPRKTFSMGHACDKRYYTEARRIRLNCEMHADKS